MTASALRPSVRDGLRAHGIEPLADDTPERLRERLNDRYLEDVRQLKARQRAGEIPLHEYSRHVQALKEQYPLLGLPLPLWAE